MAEGDFLTSHATRHETPSHWYDYATEVQRGTARR